MAFLQMLLSLLRVGVKDKRVTLILALLGTLWGGRKLYSLLYLMQVKSYYRKLREEFQEKRGQLTQYTRSKVNQSKISAEERDAITNLTLSELVEKLKNKTLKPTQVLLAYQGKALEVHDRTNCLVYPFPEAEHLAAEVELRDPDEGLLYGVPVSLKDGYFVKGHVSAEGLSSLLSEVAPDDCVIVKVLKQQGAIPFVKTTVPMMAVAYHCKNRITGDTTHPDDPEYSPGGSTSGEGALIGGGGSILGFGSDVGGSVRNPAAWGGFATLKPTSQRLSLRGIPNNLNSGNHILHVSFGPMARDVTSLELAMRALCCDLMYEMDKQCPPLPWRSEIYQSQRPLRIGYNLGEGLFPVVPACANVVLEVKDALEKQGHTLVPWVGPHPEYGAKYEVHAALSELGMFSELMYGDPPNECADVIFERPPGAKGRLLTNLKILLEKAKDPFIGKLIESWALRGNIREWMGLAAENEDWRTEWQESWMNAGLDAVITPATAIPTTRMRKNTYLQMLAAFDHHAVCNMLNIPAGVVPVRRTTAQDVEDMTSYNPDISDWIKDNIKQDFKEGQHLGVQCITLMWEEELCLRTMREIEIALQKNK